MKCCWSVVGSTGTLLEPLCSSLFAALHSQTFAPRSPTSIYHYEVISTFLGGLNISKQTGKKRKKEPIPPLFHSPWNCSSVVLERKYWEIFFSTSFFSQICNHDNAEEQLGGMMMGWWGKGVWQLLRSRPFVSSVCSESWTVGVDLWWCNTTVCCLKRFFTMSAQLSHLTPDSTLPAPPSSNSLCKKSVLKCYLTHRQKPWNEVFARVLKWLKSQTALEEFHRAAAQLEVSAPFSPPMEETQYLKWWMFILFQAFLFLGRQ